MKSAARLKQQDIHAAVTGLMQVTPGRGLARTIFNVVVLNCLLVATFRTEPLAGFVAMAVLTGTFYSTVMMTTHDAIHHTLTGWFWFDEITPRFLSYFVFWPHGTYSELHKMHHRMNGKDLADPERPTPSVAAWRAASPVGRFLIRWHLPLALFVYGGFGMILRHVVRGFQLWREEPRVRRMMILDGVGIGLALAVTLGVIVTVGVTWRYLLYLLVVERVIGFFQQLRSHLEHYGLHGGAGSLVEIRLYNCRNVSTSLAASQFFNGLNFHSVHHAFPRIPFYHLGEAHRRIASLCDAAGAPLPKGDGYLRTMMDLTRAPVLVDETGAVLLEDARRECRAAS